MVKKLFYFSIICGLSHYLTAQVGIGTDNPEAALHVVPKNNQNSLKVEGLKTVGSGDDLLSIDNNGVVNKTLLSSIKSEIKGEIGRGEEVTGVLIEVKHVLGTVATIVDPRKTDHTDIDGISITYTPKVNCNALVTISALPIPISPGYAVHGTVDLVVNDKKVSSQYYSASDSPKGDLPHGTIKRLGNYSTITRVVPLNAGTKYTFKLQAKSWKNITLFNREPTSEYTYLGDTSTKYEGAIDSDSDSMKSSMTILFYSR